MTRIPTVEESAERMKREIRQDLAQGRVPRSIGCFADTDNYVDINCYGGFCEDDLFDALIAHYGGRDEHECMPAGMRSHIDKAQDIVDAWIKEGGHLQ